MKKVLAIVAALMLIPFTAYGMQSISEQEMSEVSGQSGVAIAIDDVKIYEDQEGKEIWYETTNTLDDQTGNLSEGSAAVGMEWQDGATTMMHVNAIMSEDGENLESPGRDLQGEYDYDNFDFSNTTVGGNDVFTSSALTISVTDDVAIIGEALDNAHALGDGGDGDRDTFVTGVSIGLPTVEIYEDTQSWDIINVMATTENPKNLDREDGNITDSANAYSYGTLYSYGGGSTTAILDGQLEIVPLDNYADAKPEM